MMNELVVMYTKDDVATMNPETLMENGESAASLLGLPEPVLASASLELAARNLARILLDSSPIALARLLDNFAENGGHTPAVGNATIDLLNRKVVEASPDEINGIVAQAKAEHVWQWIKPSVMARNDELAKRVTEITNPDALDTYLRQVALTTGDSPWLPGPIYDAAARVVRQLATTADILQLDMLGNLAWEWRFKKKVSNALRERHDALLHSIAKYSQGNGYVMKHDTKTILVDTPSRALRLAQRGFQFVPKGE